MEEYEERTDSISVPKNAGTDGFMRTIKSILDLPRVQRIEVNASGEVKYTRIAKQGDGRRLVVEFADLEPWSIIRNGDLEEVAYDRYTSAANTIASMFNQLAQAGLVPIAFVSGANSHFWDWHEHTSGVRLTRQSSIYGLQMYSDRMVPDHALIMCAAYTRGASLAACHKFLMVSMHLPDVADTPAEDEVQIL